MSKLTKNDLIEYTILQRELAIRKARNNFWSFCKFMYPNFYTDNKTYLKELCDTLEKFYTNEINKQILIINLPPRHGKTFTARLFVLWMFGQNSRLKIMTGSYNQILSSLFSQQTRDAIGNEKIQQTQDDYEDVFREVKIKQGDASKGFWSLDGSEEKNYLATSPNGTATGIGANFVIIDDVIKTANDAYNERVLDEHWEWYNNTIAQRMERPRKQLLIMTRWSSKDLCGRMITSKGEKCHVVTFKAVQEDGSMLCDDIMTREEYEDVVSEMGVDIASANYQQEPMDLKNSLYTDLKEYQTLPEGYQIKSVCDVADEGTDYLCNIVYAEKERKAYIIDVLFTKEKQEITENKLARTLKDNEVNYAWFESNAGGKAFARLVENKTRQLGNIKTKFDWDATTKNKQSRILANSSIVENNVFFPLNWRSRFKDFSKNVLGYQREGKNEHDDGPDALTMIAEKLNKAKAQVFDKRGLGI